MLRNQRKQIQGGWRELSALNRLSANSAGAAHVLKAAKPRPRRKLRFSLSRGGHCRQINVKRTSSGSASVCCASTASTSAASRRAQRNAAVRESGARPLLFFLRAG